jgi:hypothetical protein
MEKWIWVGNDIDGIVSTSIASMASVTEVTVAVRKLDECRADAFQVETRGAAVEIEIARHSVAKVDCDGGSATQVETELFADRPRPTQGTKLFLRELDASGHWLSETSKKARQKGARSA